MNIFFGTDGWRAHIDTEINEETVSIAAQAFADFIHRNYKEKSPCVALAYDTRKNSQLFATTFAEVLSGNRIQYYYPTGSPRHPYYLMPPYTLIAVPA